MFSAKKSFYFLLYNSWWKLGYVVCRTEPEQKDS
jgi:hypothetical protein